VDLDYLVHHVMEHPKRLDMDRLVASPIPLIALATHVPTGQRHAFREWGDRGDFLRSLRAGASMPIVSGPPYEYRGTTFWDALLVEPIPTTIAEEDGATHIVALMTRPSGTTGPRMSPLERFYVLPRLRAASPALAERYRARGEEYGATVRRLWQGRGTRGKASVLPIGPAGPVVGKLERDRSRLVDSCAQGFRAVATAFGVEVARFAELLTGFEPSGQPLSARPRTEIRPHGNEHEPRRQPDAGADRRATPARL
jgi:predicted patatin/cPLA2 family phospholipase